MNNIGINQIGIPKFQHPWRTLQVSKNSGTWGNRGKGNELQSALEKGLSWLGDKFINGAEYVEDGFNYLLTVPLATITGKTEEIPRVINELKEDRHKRSQHYAMNPVFDLISPIKGGWMLKGLTKGSQLERALSKTGTININSLQAYLNKASKLEQDVIGRVLNTRFAGQKNIDYNDLRKAVSDELITYSRVPQTEYAEYGLDRLGYESRNNYVVGKGNVIEYPEVKTSTYTFESPRIPEGNDLHYNETTLGHSRTYTTPDEPEVLHVMESQSDWAQQTKDLKPRFTYTRDVNGNTNIIFDETGKFHYTENGKGMPYKEFMDTSKPNDQFPFYIAKTQFQEIYPHAQVKHLHENYLPRQLQENMIFAAQQGQKKMRYPTPDTAAKIEGYTKGNRSQLLNLRRLIQKAEKDFEDGIIEYKEYDRLVNDLQNQMRAAQNTGEYIPEHQTILKKYADFPKMFNKLFKNQEVRTITDSKGNTWYEVDIPENFLQSEWQFKKGGILGLHKIIGL